MFRGIIKLLQSPFLNNLISKNAEKFAQEVAKTLIKFQKSAIEEVLSGDTISQIKFLLDAVKTAFEILKEAEMKYYVTGYIAEFSALAGLDNNIKEEYKKLDLDPEGKDKDLLNPLFDKAYLLLNLLDIDQAKTDAMKAVLTNVKNKFVVIHSILVMTTQRVQGYVVYDKNQLIAFQNSMESFEAIAAAVIEVANKDLEALSKDSGEMVQSCRRIAASAYETEILPGESVPAELIVRSVSISETPVRGDRAAFIVDGEGITSVSVRVFDLKGVLVFQGTSLSNSVEFSAAQQLPNGVYLYVLTIQRGGKVYISNVRKIAILR
jgi:hypothetical protein